MQTLATGMVNCWKKGGEIMSMTGLGVMLSNLGGNAESVKAFTSCVGKEISELSLGKDDALHFVFRDGVKIRLFDDGQSCCEHRYMTTDDKLSDFIGATLMSAELKSAAPEPDEYGDHEIQFLDVTTSKGVFQMKSHNKHNGYYGGFAIRASLE